MSMKTRSKAYPVFPLLDTDFDKYEQCELDDMVSAAKSGVISSANENLFSLPTSKDYENTYDDNRRLKEKQKKEQDRYLEENPPITLGTPNPQQLAYKLTDRQFKVLLDFASSKQNKKLFKKYTN